jgi:nucleoside-diphosphate-sugar epimerase
MRSDHIGPYNIGSEEMVSINQLVDIAALVAGKDIVKNHIPGPEGVRGRNSENSLFERDLGFRPHFDLKKGIEKTYLWISEQVKNA